MTIKVLALALQPRIGPSSRFRVYEFIEPLKAHGIDLQVSPFFTDKVMKLWMRGEKKNPLVIARTLIAVLERLNQLLRTGEYDVLYLHRQAAPFSQYWFDPLLKLTKIPVVYDMDDSVFEDYPIDDLLRHSVAATVGNQYLADYVRRVAPATPVTVIPTVVDMQKYQSRTPSPQETRLKVGWVGTPSTFHTYLKPILPELVASCRELNAEVVVITDASVQTQAEELGATFVPWELAREVQHLQELDVGIMPLSANKHVLGKCAFKLIQYGAVALPSVGTDIGANAEVIQDGVTGYLSHSPEQMLEQVKTLLQDDVARERMGRAARTKINAEFSLESQVPVLARVLREASQGRRSGQ